MGLAHGQPVHCHCEAPKPGGTERAGIVQYKRTDTRADADSDSGEVEPDEREIGRGFVAFVNDNEALIDAILYDWYPDRLPGELDDDLDLLRFFRMVQAKNIMSVEDARQVFFDGGSKPPDAQNRTARRQYAENVKRWAEHDALIKRLGQTD